MALDRNQAGILFNIDVDASNAQQNLEMFKGAVSGAAAEMREQFVNLAKTLTKCIKKGEETIIIPLNYYKGLVAFVGQGCYFYAIMSNNK